MDPATLIRALHFPEDAQDTEGFAALRRALGDARIAPLIKAAQDVLTRLAQEGIYMDDLRPDRARPEFWRAFAQGTRGAFGRAAWRHPRPVLPGAECRADAV